MLDCDTPTVNYNTRIKEGVPTDARLRHGLHPSSRPQGDDLAMTGRCASSYETASEVPLLIPLLLLRV